MELCIGENIRRLRKNMEIGQEALANEVGVSVQAVSKWETGQSVPDVGIIPDIAAFFGVSIDSLFFGEMDGIGNKLPFPEDDVLYIVQVRNGSVLGKGRWDKEKPVKLALEDIDGKLDIQIWGNAEIDGNVSGNAMSGNSLTCKDVGGGVNAGDGVNCGNIGGGVNAGDGVNCGNISGGVSAGDSVNCGNICGAVNAGNDVNCANISGDVTSNGDIHCAEIYSADKIACETLYAKGSIKCKAIECEGDIHTEEKLDNIF